jgi:hypothetical protein
MLDPRAAFPLVEIQRSDAVARVEHDFGATAFDEVANGGTRLTVGEYELLYLSTCGEGGATPCASEQTPASDK